MSNKEQYEKSIFDKEYFEKDFFLQKDMFKSNINDWLAEIYKKSMRKTYHYKISYFVFLVNGLFYTLLRKINRFFLKYIG
jgi:hypothetical protein